MDAVDAISMDAVDTMNSNNLDSATVFIHCRYRTPEYQCSNHQATGCGGCCENHAWAAAEMQHLDAEEAKKAEDKKNSMCYEIGCTRSHNGHWVGDGHLYCSLHEEDACHKYNLHIGLKDQAIRRGNNHNDNENNNENDNANPLSGPFVPLQCHYPECLNNQARGCGEYCKTHHK